MNTQPPLKWLGAKGKRRAHTQQRQQQKRIQRQTHTKNATLVFHIMSQSNKARDPTLHEIGSNLHPPYFRSFFPLCCILTLRRSQAPALSLPSIVYMHGT